MTYQGSNIKTVQVLIEQCYSFGVKHVIISPGSRNAPLIISFDNHPAFTCYPIPDERSAAFYALGMARQLNQPVAVVCTSGTAVLNFAPALTEAYYQNIPLIAITADRPPELIDQEDGQTIRQKNIYNNHIGYSANLPIYNDNKSITESKNLINQALSKAVGLGVNNNKLPVHINIPFAEPLYETCTLEIKKEKTAIPASNKTLTEKQRQNFSEAWSKSKKVLLISGVSLPNNELEQNLNKLATEKNIAVIAPPTANINEGNVFTTPENLFLSITENETDSFKPDLLITIGGPVVSKATKNFLRKNNPLFHFDIDTNPVKVNTYQCLTDLLNVDPIYVFNIIFKHLEKKDTVYINLWKQKNKKVITTSNKLLSNIEWSDLLVFKLFFEGIKSNINLHLANSTPIRYAELFAKHNKINYYCNRGTSGIDGCTSTAAGAAIVSKKNTLLITGDISFFYDSNAFWNSNVPNNLKIILINNSGGNIFKIIKGPRETKQLKKYFEMHQQADAKKLCGAFGVNYLSAKNKTQFTNGLKNLTASTKCTVLEIFTPSEKSAEILIRHNSK